MVKRKLSLEVIKSLTASATFKQTLITFSGTFLNGVFGLIFYILSARFLGPEGFGVMVVAITTLTLLGDIGDFGVNTSIVRFVGKYSETDILKSKIYLKLGLTIKATVSMLIVLIGFVLAPYVSLAIFEDLTFVLPFRIALVGVATYLFFTFITASLQATNKFLLWSLIQISSNGVRLVILGLLFSGGVLTLNTNLGNYVIVPLVGFLIGICLLPKGFLKVRSDNSVFKNFINYSKWVAGFSVLAAFSARLDIYLTAKLLSSFELGIYSAANQLVQVIPQVVAALSVVLAPKMASMGDFASFKRYFRKTQVMVLGVAFVGLISLPIINLFIPMFLSNLYINSVPVFSILFIAMLFLLISVPIHVSIYYYFSYPKLFFYIAFLHLGIIVVLGWQLISKFGVIGAAVTVLVGQIFNFIIPLIWVFRKIKKAPVLTGSNL